MIIVACPYLQTVRASTTYHIPGESTSSPEHAGALREPSRAGYSVLLSGPRPDGEGLEVRAVPLAAVIPSSRAPAGGPERHGAAPRQRGGQATPRQDPAELAHHPEARPSRPAGQSRASPGSYNATAATATPNLDSQSGSHPGRLPPRRPVDERPALSRQGACSRRRAVAGTRQIDRVAGATAVCAARTANYTPAGDRQICRTVIPISMGICYQAVVRDDLAPGRV